VSGKTADLGELTPLLARGSPLDTRAQDVIESVHLAELAKVQTLPTDDERDAKRRQRVEWTREEMLAQPAAITETLESEREAIREVAAALARSEPRRFWLAGCGDSLAVMVGMRSLLETLLGVPCEPIESLDFAYYYADLCGPGDVVIALSSSGETARTVEAVLVAAAHGATTLTLTNTAGSTLAREGHHSLLVHATRRGWPTQASTAAMALVGQVAIELGRRRGKVEEADRFEAEIQQLPECIGQVLEAHEPAMEAIARHEAVRSLFLYAGGGPAYACAMVGAAKVKECSPAHAIAIPLEEYHHYNSQKAADPLVLFAPAGRTVPRAVETARAGRRAGGRVHVVISEGESRFDDEVDSTLRLPVIPEPLAPIVYMVPGQLFAYHVAMEKFRMADARQG
jgi:glucosamine--fructose-6-phosphate aminotransferase (isomerizing)